MGSCCNRNKTFVYQAQFNQYRRSLFVQYLCFGNTFISLYHHFSARKRNNHNFSYSIFRLINDSVERLYFSVSIVILC